MTPPAVSIARAVPSRRSATYRRPESVNAAVPPAVGGVADDAARLLAGALAPGALLGREVLLFRSEDERERVGDEAFRPGGEVERPQARDRVGAASAAEEHDAVAVRGEGEATWRPEREAAGAGLATRKTVGHTWQSAGGAQARGARVVSSRRARRPP